MNANDLARIAYIKEQEADAITAGISATMKALRYSAKFDEAYQRAEIRRAGERAHWLNIILPAIKSGKGISRWSGKPVE